MDEEKESREAIREEGLNDNDNEWEDSDDDHGDKEYGVHDPSVHCKQMKPHLGERFPCQEELRFCLTNYAVRNGYPINITKSSSERLQAKYGKDRRCNKCTFKLWASWMNGEHSFQGQCYRANKKAQELLTGKLTEHYARIWDYVAEIVWSNPGNITQVGVHVKEDGSTVFYKFYVCFKAIKDGWNRACRRGKGIMYDDIEPEGNTRMHEVVVVTNFKMHAHARDLRQSGYSETEVLDAIKEQDVIVEHIPETDVEHIPEANVEHIPETQVEQMGVEQVPETDVELVPETDVEEGLNETPPSQRMIRKKRPSERVLLQKLKRRVGGQGSNSKDPVSLE
ncbi:hypothetical protein LXL04_003889 [Taraxacum kok-saghyz]